MKPLLRRRLSLALASLALLMTGAAVLALMTHAALRDDIARVADAERDTHAALVLSLAARDLYAHQAHSIILNDTSHLGHLGDSEQEVANLVTALRGFIGDGDLKDEVDALAREIDGLRSYFRQDVAPRIGARDALVAAHDGLLRRVEAITAATDRLTTELRGRALDARAHADQQTTREAIVMVSLAVLAALFAVVAALYLTRLAGTERLASVGALAAGVAHEVNNPLTAILGHARLLQRSSDADTAASARLIAAETERCQTIVRALVDLTRPQRLQRVEVEVRDLVDDVVEALRVAGLNEAVVVEGRATVMADGPKLRQVIWNLLKNACEAGGRVRVDVSAGERVRVRVADEGAGVNESVRARLFEPFVTSKAEGTGLGLAVSAALVKAHGGTLKLVPSERGATFELELPRRTS